MTASEAPLAGVRVDRRVMPCVVPITLAQAKAFIAEHHRHNKPPTGWKFGVGLRVVVWIGSHDWRGEWKEGFFYKGRWYVEGYTDPAVTHWGDVTPPEKGND